MPGYTMEEQQEFDRIRGSWSSPWYPVLFFLVAMPIEVAWWWKAPFMQFGWQILLGLTIVVAAVPWIGSRGHAADSAALRQHPARFAFLVPMLVLHGGMIALYGPYWRSGPGEGSVTVNRLLKAMVEPATMANLFVAAVSRSNENDASVNLRDIGLLRRLGADVNAPADDGRFPLDVADQSEVFAALLDAGARAHSDHIASLLHRAIDAEDATMLARLLALGVAPDLLRPDDASRISAAQFAARWGYVEALETLLAAGASLAHRDAQGRSVRDHATNGGDADILAVIARHEARAATNIERP